MNARRQWTTYIVDRGMVPRFDYRWAITVFHASRTVHYWIVRPPAATGWRPSINRAHSRPKPFRCGRAIDHASSTAPGSRPTVKARGCRGRGSESRLIDDHLICTTKLRMSHDRDQLRNTVKRTVALMDRLFAILFRALITLPSTSIPIVMATKTSPFLCSHPVPHLPHVLHQMFGRDRDAAILQAPYPTVLIHFADLNEDVRARPNNDIPFNGLAFRQHHAV